MAETQATTITIAYADIVAKVKRSLSVIGKRANADSKAPFSGIVLSSAEETLFNGLIEDGVMEIVASFNPLVYLNNADANGFALDVSNKRRTPTNEQYGSTLAFLAKEYVASYVLSEYLSMYYAEFAENFVNKRNSVLDNLGSVLHTKYPTASNFSSHSGGTSTAPLAESITLSQTEVTVGNDSADEIEITATITPSAATQRVAWSLMPDSIGGDLTVKFKSQTDTSVILSPLDSGIAGTTHLVASAVDGSNKEAICVINVVEK